MMYTCLIVDDEAPAHKVLRHHLEKISQLQLVGHCYNGQEALDFLSKNKVDLVFLDINMPKLNGMDLLDCLTNKPVVILTSAHSNYGFEAYQKEVTDYLLKPIGYPRFFKAVSKALHLLEGSQNEKPKIEIEIKHNGVEKRVLLKDLVYIESMGNYLRLHTLAHGTLVVQQTLKFIESQLPESQFIRIHKSYIVNVQVVQTIVNGVLVLNNSTQLPIGRKYSAMLERLDAKNRATKS